MRDAVRFSRASVAEVWRGRAESADRDFYNMTGRHFDPGNGYAQVRDLSVEAAVAYGRWVALKDAARDLSNREIP